MTWGKIASWGVAAAVAAGSGLAGPPARSGQVFVPRGFTLSTLQYTRPYLDGARAYASVLAETEAQVNAIAGAWHGNIARFQVEQDDLVVREDAGDHSYLSLIRAAVRYAQAKGLVVVLNAQTEPGTFTTTATLHDWPGCVNVPDVRGPGALLMAWFTRRAG